jgi:hypothetical protein
MLEVGHMMGHKRLVELPSTAYEARVHEEQHDDSGDEHGRLSLGN